MLAACMTLSSSKWERHSVAVGPYDVTFELPNLAGQDNEIVIGPLESIPLGNYDERTRVREVMKYSRGYRPSSFRAEDGSIDMDIIVVALSADVMMPTKNLEKVAEQYYVDRVEYIRKSNLEAKRQGKMLFPTPTRLDFVLHDQKGCAALWAPRPNRTSVLIPLDERNVLIASSGYWLLQDSKFHDAARSAMIRFIESITLTAADSGHDLVNCNAKDAF